VSKKFDVNSVVNERKNELDSSPFFQSKQNAPNPVKTASPTFPKKSTKRAVNTDSVKDSIDASMLSGEDTIETIRKSVKRTGEKVTYIRLTKVKKSEVKDIVYTYAKLGIETSENEIGQIGLKWLVEEYKANGQNSVLAKVLAALND
jgi:hypothetical protein